MDEFTYDGCRISYSTFGTGERPIVLVHGQLLPARMMHPLAEALAHRGFYAICPDLLGHGESDRPREAWRYSMELWAEQVVALLDHLGIERAVVGGTSLGANISLEVGVLAPERLAGIVIDAPVLEDAVAAGLVAFAPLMFMLRSPLGTLLSKAANAIPPTRGGHGSIGFWLDILRDLVRQDPKASAAVLQGVLFGRVAPPRSRRKEIQTPTLVLCHAHDPIHVYSDAELLAEELPNARFVRATWMGELRLNPDRLTGEIVNFLEECWSVSHVPVHTERA